MARRLSHMEHLAGLVHEAIVMHDEGLLDLAADRWEAWLIDARITLEFVWQSGGPPIVE